MVGVVPDTYYATFNRFMLATVALGGHIRTGMEDCVWLCPGKLAESNAQMVKQWVEAAKRWSRPIAGAHVVRTMLGLPLGESSALAA